MLKILILVVFFLLLKVQAQVIDAPINPIDFQQNPSGIEWKKIETEHFDIIFPQEVTREAQRVAHILEAAYPFVVRSLEDAPKRIPLVLQNQSVGSNGFVTLAPYRSEFFLTPAVDPELGNTEWLKTLGIHEFRHVVQFQKGRRGFSRYLSLLLGEAGQAIGLGLTAPPWLFEGDAVGIETALTRGGRGRLPLFERDLRTLLLSGQEYSYDKAHLGSFKDYVPNHYVYGYFYTTYMRNHYGDLFLSQVMNHSAENSWNPLSFYRSMDKLTPEQNFEEFYRSVLRELIQEWDKRVSALNPTDYEVKTPEHTQGWTNYLYPQVTSEGHLVALKRGLSFIPRFVMLKEGSEQTLFYPGSLTQEFPFKLRSDRLAYTEMDLHPRWGYQDFSRLKVYDLKKNQHILTLSRTKYRLPVLDQAGEKIAVVEWNSRQEQKIHILNLKGKKLLTKPFPSERVITSIDWKSSRELVMVLRERDDRKRLISFNLESGEEQDLVSATETNLGFVSVEEGKILLESPESGIDNIYLVDGGLKQIVSSKYGAYAPKLHQGKLLYNNYSALGMTISEKSPEWSSEEKSEGSFFPYFERFAQAENLNLFEEELKTSRTYEVKDYDQLAHAVNLHSWLILAPPLGPSVILQGYSRDILNKFSLSAGYSYNLNEQTSEGFVSAAWSHLYPVFDMRAGYGGRRQDVIRGGRKIENRWEEGTFEVGMQVPWKGIYGRFISQFTLRSFARLIKVTNKLTRDITEISNGALFSPGVEAQFAYTSRQAARDLNPEWGIFLSAHFEEGRDITGDDQRGALESFDSRIYLPGFMAHHSFYHQLAYEKQRDRFYQYQGLVLYPRGTRSPYLDEFFKTSSNYLMPVFYPDWNWSRYFYLKRVNLNLFYDFLDGRVGGFDYRASSAGWEVIFDTNILRLALPLSFGLRGSYPIEGGEDHDYEIFLASTLGTF